MPGERVEARGDVAELCHRAGVHLAAAEGGLSRVELRLRLTAAACLIDEALALLAEGRS